MSSGPLQELVAVLGSPAAGHPAQYLFERAFASAGIDWRIITCDVAEGKLAAAIAGVDGMGFRGCLVAGPLRHPALSLVTTASPSAAFAGGVGLIERSAHGLIGHMTDGRGAVEAIRSHADPSGKHTVVIGASLTGRAVALELMLAGASSVWLADPEEQRGKKLVEDLTGLQRVSSEWISSETVVPLPAAAGIVVNTISRGMTFDGLRADIVFADASPTGSSTEAARAAGCCIVDNLEIRAIQAAIEFRTLTGFEADVEMLREALDEYLS